MRYWCLQIAMGYAGEPTLWPRFRTLARSSDEDERDAARTCLRLAGSRDHREPRTDHRR